MKQWNYHSEPPKWSKHEEFVNKKSENPIWVIFRFCGKAKLCEFFIVFPKDVGIVDLPPQHRVGFTWGTCQSGWCPATLVNKYTTTDSSHCAMDTSVGWMRFSISNINISQYKHVYIYIYICRHENGFIGILGCLDDSFLSVELFLALSCLIHLEVARWKWIMALSTTPKVSWRTDTFKERSLPGCTIGPPGENQIFQAFEC